MFGLIRQARDVLLGATEGLPAFPKLHQAIGISGTPTD